MKRRSLVGDLRVQESACADIPKYAFNVRVLDQSLLHDLHSLALWVGVTCTGHEVITLRPTLRTKRALFTHTWAEPAVGHRATTAVALLNEGDRLFWAQQGRRGFPFCLQIL